MIGGWDGIAVFVTAAAASVASVACAVGAKIIFSVVVAVAQGFAEKAGVEEEIAVVAVVVDEEMEVLLEMSDIWEEAGSYKIGDRKNTSDNIDAGVNSGWPQSPSM